jgi:hypothetical protein
MEIKSQVDAVLEKELNLMREAVAAEHQEELGRLRNEIAALKSA